MNRRRSGGGTSVLRRQRQTWDLHQKTPDGGAYNTTQEPRSHRLSRVALGASMKTMADFLSVSSRKKWRREWKRGAQRCFSCTLLFSRSTSQQEGDYLCITMDVSDQSPRLHSPRVYNRDTKETSS